MYTLLQKAHKDKQRITPVCTMEPWIPIAKYCRKSKIEVPRDVRDKDKHIIKHKYNVRKRKARWETAPIGA